MSTTAGQSQVTGRHQGVAADLPVEGEMPPLDGATAWLNSPPLTTAGLRGRVVLVQFWTYTCINWRRTLPYVREWAEKYRDRDLVVVGVHTPEFGFEHDVDNVRREAQAMAITYPIAIDNEYEVWQAFANEYWPALYFIDAEGRIRHHRFGEGDYERSEMVIRQLLAETGIEDVSDGLVAVDAGGSEAAADWDDLRSPETYLGYQRTTNLDASDFAPDKPHHFDAPALLSPNHWALSGDWTVGPEAITLNQPNGLIAYQFHARDLHVILAPRAMGSTVPFRVRMDGQPPGIAHGADVDEEGRGAVSEPRMYQLIRQPTPIADRRFEIEFADSGIQAFDFTFG